MRSSSAPRPVLITIYFEHVHGPRPLRRRLEWAGQLNRAWIDPTTNPLPKGSWKIVGPTDRWLSKFLSSHPVPGESPRRMNQTGVGERLTLRESHD